MRRADVRRWAAVTAGAASAVVGAWATPAAAALSDQLCLPSGETALPGYPSGAELQRAAAVAEQRLARRGAADPFSEIGPALELPAAGAEKPSPLAVAEYCSAAGELMRVSAQ